jgi:hypothetical protein
MNNPLQEKVEAAFNQLLQDSSKNKANITQYREKIAELRQRIRAEVGVLEQHQTTITLDDDKELKATRSKAINIDCQVLKQQITDIAAHIQNQQTAEALTLIEPMKAGFSLLKARVDYIDQLEKLLESYQEEITISQTLKHVAKALNISNFVDEMETPPTATDEIIHEFIPNNSLSEGQTTLH